MKRYWKKAFEIAAAAALFVGCATTKAPVQKDVKGGAEIVDWQGSEFGKPIPDWVEAVSENDYARLSALPEMDGTVPFAVTGTGQDRDLLKVWVSTNDASAELSRLIKSNVTASAGTILNGNKDGEASKKMAEAITTVFSNTQFSGFAKMRDFWTKVRLPEGGTEYRYYVLYSMEKENLAYQIDVALGKIAAENKEEQDLLDKIHEQAKITAMSALGTTQAVR